MKVKLSGKVARATKSSKTTEPGFMRVLKVCGKVTHFHVDPENRNAVKATKDEPATDIYVSQEWLESQGLDPKTTNATIRVTIEVVT